MAIFTFNSMYNPQDARTAYNRVYTTYQTGEQTHDVSVRDLAKAQRRVQQVCRTFGIRLGSANVLDVGCGLGFFTRALTLAGASVTGIDISDTGIDLARRTFPCCRFLRGAFPVDVGGDQEFDLIWAVDLSVVNTFDVEAIQRDFIVPALARLRPGGAVVIGWHTDFSGRTIGHWANWSRKDFERMRSICGLSSPRIVQIRNAVLGKLVMRTCEWLRKPAPVFFERTRE